MKLAIVVITVVVTAVALFAGYQYVSPVVSDASSARPEPKQVLVGAASRRDPVTSTSFKDFVPTPGQAFDTTTTGILMVQFTATADLSDNKHSLSYQAVIDGKTVIPGAMKVSGRGSHSIAYSGFLGVVPAGKHVATMQMMVDGGKAIVGNRTFAVWTVSE